MDSLGFSTPLLIDQFRSSYFCYAKRVSFSLRENADGVSEQAFALQTMPLFHFVKKQVSFPPYPIYFFGLRVFIRFHQ